MNINGIIKIRIKEATEIITDIHSLAFLSGARSTNYSNLNLDNAVKNMKSYIKELEELQEPRKKILCKR